MKIKLQGRHKGKLLIVSKIYNEAIELNIPESNWPLFIKTKFDEADSR